MSCTVDHASNDRRTLCFECGRARHASRGADAAETASADVPLEAVRSPLALALTDRQIAHRRAMLEFARRDRH